MTSENNFVSDDDHVHEDVEVDIVVAHVRVVNNHNNNKKYASKGKKDHVVEDMEKDVKTLCEDVVSSNESIFLECSINNMVYIVFNKHIKSMMGFIKVFVNEFQIEVEDVEEGVKDILYDIVVPALKKNKKIVDG